MNPARALPPYPVPGRARPGVLVQGHREQRLTGLRRGRSPGALDRGARFQEPQRPGALLHRRTSGRASWPAREPGSSTARYPAGSSGRGTVVPSPDIPSSRMPVRASIASAWVMPSAASTAGSRSLVVRGVGHLHHQRGRDRAETARSHAVLDQAFEHGHYKRLAPVADHPGARVRLQVPAELKPARPRRRGPVAQAGRHPRGRVRRLL